MQEENDAENREPTSLQEVVAMKVVFVLVRWNVMLLLVMVLVCLCGRAS
jgi:hypothetical protein